MSETLTTEQVEEILAGCKGVTPGPWKMEGSIYEHMGAGIRSIPDDRGFAQLWSSGTVALDTAHIARLDPQTVSSLATELLALRKRVGELEGAKRVSDRHLGIVKRRLTYALAQEDDLDV